MLEDKQKNESAKLCRHMLALLTHPSLVYSTILATPSNIKYNAAYTSGGVAATLLTHNLAEGWRGSVLMFL